MYQAAPSFTIRRSAHPAETALFQCLQLPSPILKGQFHDGHLTYMFRGETLITTPLLTMTSWQKVSNLPSSGMQRPSVSLRTNVPRHLITVIKSYVCLVLGPIEEKQPPTPYPQSTYDSEQTTTSMLPRELESTLDCCGISEFYTYGWTECAQIGRASCRERV